MYVQSGTLKDHNKPYTIGFLNSPATSKGDYFMHHPYGPDTGATAQHIEFIATHIEHFITHNDEASRKDKNKLRLLAQFLYHMLQPLPPEGEDPFAQHDYEHHI